MSLKDDYDLAINEEFLQKVRMSAISAAVEILAEPRQRGFSAYFDKRAALANTVLGVTANTAVGGVMMLPGQGEPVVQRFAYAVSSNPAVDESSSDQDIQFTVNTMWNALAGVTTDEMPEPPAE